MMFNQSVLYLTPLLYYEIGIDPEFINSITNTYLRNSDDEIDDDLFLIHHKFQNNDDYLSYEDKLLKSELFCKTIDVNEDVIYVLKFPKKYKNDYLNFKSSNYSKFNSESKKIILQSLSKIYGEHSKVSINKLMNIKQVLNKEISLKIQLEKRLNITLDDQQELGEFVDLNKETFNLKMLNELTQV